MITTVFNFTTLWLYIIPNCTRLSFIPRKVSISTCLGDRLALFLEQMFRAAEKIHSDGVEVAGMRRKDLARFDSVGKRPSFSLHNLRGSSFLESVASPKYSRTSYITTWIFRSSSDSLSSFSLKLSVSEWRRVSRALFLSEPLALCSFASCVPVVLLLWQQALQHSPAFDAIFRSQKLQVSVSGVQGSCKNNWIFFVCWYSANTPPSLCYPFFCTSNERFSWACLKLALVYSPCQPFDHLWKTWNGCVLLSTKVNSSSLKRCQPLIQFFKQLPLLWLQVKVAFPPWNYLGIWESGSESPVLFEESLYHMECTVPSCTDILDQCIFLNIYLLLFHL